MSIYAAKARSAHAKILAKGAPVIFTHTSSTLDPSTGLHTSPVSTTVAGALLGTEANLREYERLSLVASGSRTLLFAAATHGELPALGSTVVWGGVTYSVRSVVPFDPDGTPLISTVILSE